MTESNNSVPNQDASVCPHCQKQITQAALPTTQPPEKPIPNAFKMSQEEYWEARDAIGHSGNY